MEKIPCSVPILTLNSEKYLGRCLESTRDFADVFIVDGNSTDGTHAIAKRYGVPIYKQIESDEPNVRISNFTEVRSRAYARAKTDWILVLDSDEYLTPALAKSIQAAIGQHGNTTDVAFLVEKKLSIAGREIAHAFFREIAVRLYNRKSGIGYLQGKLVHEKLEIPAHIKEEKLDGVFYSEEIASYRAGVSKDNYYLSLVWKKMLEERPKPYIGYWMISKSIVVSLVRALKIIFVSCLIYLRYGYARSLPLSHVVRHARYHLLLSVFRIRQLWMNVFLRR